MTTYGTCTLEKKYAGKFRLVYEWRLRKYTTVPLAAVWNISMKWLEEVCFIRYTKILSVVPIIDEETYM
jgi:hypothetical protein